MRLHSAKIPQLAREMLNAIIADHDIECEAPREVQADIEAVLSQYARDEQEIADKARDLVAQRGLPSTELGKMKRLVADERGIKLGDDAIDYLLDQLLEMLMHSNNVDEVFAEDVVLRRKLREPLRKQASAEAELQAEVRGQLKHVKEGTSMWEVEYKRMMEDLKRRKGL
ncbi:MAG: DUF507 family protein [Sorangiineae bacterium]|nr:DUF507 family protein [Polyangiaceae bacterium]MEB2322284.1 DUF507 family protein [Sorangiineae bacterium]